MSFSAPCFPASEAKPPHRRLGSVYFINIYTQLTEYSKAGRVQMARMYSRKKGKSGSKKPMIKDVSWVEMKPKEVEELIVKLAKQGVSSAMIGTILRDSHGVPLTRAVTKKSVTDIMKANGVYPKYPEPLMNMLRQSVSIRSHLVRNKKDAHSIRSLELTESNIRRMGKYYKKKKALPADWKYDPEMAKLIVGAK